MRLRLRGGRVRALFEGLSARRKENWREEALRRGCSRKWLRLGGRAARLNGLRWGIWRCQVR